MYNFRNFDFWIRSKSLAVSIYSITSEFPSSEQFGLTNQIRRSAVSIPSNIAEGASRTSKRDFARFLEIAIGSAHELETQLDISFAVGFLSKNEFIRLNDELTRIIKMTSKYKSRLVRDDGQDPISNIQRPSLQIPK